MCDPFKIFTPNGEELIIESFKNVAQQGVNEDPILSKIGMEGPVTARIQWTPPDLCYVIDAKEIRHEVDYFLLVATWTVTNTPQPFNLHRYHGDAGELQVATSEFEVPGMSGKLVMIRDDESIRLALTPSPQPSGLIEE